MKILVIGLPYFANKIAHSLSKYDVSNTYIHFNIFGSFFNKLKALIHLLNSDIVYLIGGNVSSYKLAIIYILRKNVIMHWVGTDVLIALNDAKKNKINKYFVEKSVHLCEVSWIKDELNSIGIDSSIIQIASFDSERLSTDNYQLPKIFSILSYVAKGRETFYGIDLLVQLANSFPDIDINIVGIYEYKSPLPKNIKLLGWVENMDKVYKECILYLRLPEHDGLAFSVLEALSFGRYVGYTFDFDSTCHIDNFSKLQNLVAELKIKFDNKLLDINYDGIKYIKINYSNVKVNNDLISLFNIVHLGKR